MGFLWIGHREKGLEALNQAGHRIYPQPSDPNLGDYVSAILPLSNGMIVVGYYSNGLQTIQKSHFSCDLGLQPPPKTTILFPDATDSQKYRKEVLASYVNRDLPDGGAFYVGENWNWQGNWQGHYGQKYAVLCAAGSPRNHYVYEGKYIVANSSDSTRYVVTSYIGPHNRGNDALRHWVHWIKSENPRVLFDPVMGYRRQAEWDDHGEGYEREFDGPSIFVKIQTPPHYHLVTLYFFNKDGHDGDNRDRSYTVEVKPDPGTGNLNEVDAQPTLAKTRVANFWGGVYKTFLIKGGNYYIKIGRNGSLNTIISGVFIDKLNR